MSAALPAALRLFVRDRARRRCEYCLIHEEDVWFSHEPDHIIAIKHRGLPEPENLAWTCMHCNKYKGTDLASIDNGRLVRLFHPRRDRWQKHFRLTGSLIIPKTAIGRVTEYLLEFNRPDLIALRGRLIEEGAFPR